MLKMKSIAKGKAKPTFANWSIFARSSTQVFTLNWIFVSSASVVSVLFFVYGKFISEAVQSINILSFCVKNLYLSPG